MNKSSFFRKWLFIGVLAELSILAYCYFNYPEPEELFQHAARYSGRLSLFVFLFNCYYFATRYPFAQEQNYLRLKQLVGIFAILHLIHFGFLAANVYLNQVSLEAPKVAGGALAYLLIVVYPLVMRNRKQQLSLHLGYFFYVGIVMAVTILARLKGDFPGAEASPIHYLGISALVLALIGLGWRVRQNKRPSA
ncbi:MAG: hypothetical protein AAF433_15500 [Bacteroidota bacterium]